MRRSCCVFTHFAADFSGEVAHAVCHDWMSPNLVEAALCRTAELFGVSVPQQVEDSDQLIWSRLNDSKYAILWIASYHFSL